MIGYVDTNKCRILKASFDSEMEQLLGGATYFQNLIALDWFKGEEMQEAMQAFLNKKNPIGANWLKKDQKASRWEKIVGLEIADLSPNLS